MGKTTEQKKPLTATEIAAEATVNAFARQHGEYARVAFTERDKEGGMIEGTRMRRIAPVRALEGLAVKHPKSDKPFLTEVHMMAAKKYDAMILAAQGHCDHEIKEWVDRSPSPGSRTLYHIMANDQLARLHLRMPVDHRMALACVFISSRDKTLAQVWPLRSIRDIQRKTIKDGLDWLAAEFGFRSR